MDFDNEYRRRAFVDYGLDSDQVRDAKCFAGIWIGVKALEYIKLAYDKGLDDSDKRAKAQDAFNQIKDFESKDSIEAFQLFVQYGLNPDQIRDAKCFTFGMSGVKALKSFRQAYDSCTDVDSKAARVQEIFDKIKDFAIEYHITAVVDYGLDPDQIRAAKCFGWSAIQQATAYIKKAYDSGTDLNNKIAEAQAAFYKIKDFDSKYRIEAMVDYGLNPEQVRDAKCLDWEIGHRVMEYIKQAYKSGSNLDDKLVKAQRAFTQINDKDADCSPDNMICITTKEASKDSCAVAEIIALINHVSKLDDEYMDHHMDHHFVKLISLLDEYMSIDSDAVGIFMSKHIYPYHIQTFSAHINDYHVQHSSFEMGALVTDLVEHSHV